MSRFPGSCIAFLLRLAWVGALVALVTVSAAAEDYDLNDLPRYEPGQTVSGLIRVCGHEFKGRMVQRWEEAFQKYHPQVRFQTDQGGTATAINAVALDLSDAAFIGREIGHLETLAFWRGKKRVPVSIRITSGTYTVHGDAATPALYVNRENPISELNLQQLDAILGAQHLRGAARNFRQWGDLGLTGRWAMATINIYGNWLDDGESEFIRQTVLLNSNRWNAENYHEFWNDIEKPDGQILTDAGRNWLTDKIVLGKIIKLSGAKVINAVARDVDGLAIASALAAGHEPRAKRLALASAPGQSAVVASEKNVFTGAYPLGRCTNAYFDRPGNGPLDAKMREFMRFILSREGQQIVREAKAVPLNAEFIRIERLKLE